MTIEQDVARHYGREGLADAVMAGLASLGGAAVTQEDLAALDEFHMGGRPATERLAAAMGLAAGMRVLDIGCGLGGTARFLAARHGCHVTGVDLTPAYVALATDLSRLVGLAGATRFLAGSALDLPAPHHPYDAAMLLHVGMNIEDKARLFAGVAGVLKEGGVFAVYDVMSTGDTPPDFPVPWATTPATSFLESPESYRQKLAGAGFEIVSETDNRQLALDLFQRMRERLAEGAPPLGIHLLMGESAPQKLANMMTALGQERIAPVAMMCRRG
ncbi:methyltransferase domain-containing protein [Geminicoccaceae bacterium 1502E]|nr:methyltransferase domain-containing protein [Geminicoccaceae bacterium 1502E]